MDTDAYKHSPKGKVVSPTDFQVLQAIVIQETVVKAFTGSSFTVYFFVFFGIPWNAGMETQVTVVFYVNGAAIVSGRTFISVRT